MKLKFCVKEIPRVELDVEGASADDSGKVGKEQRKQDAIRCLKSFIMIIKNITFIFCKEKLQEDFIG